MAKTKRKSTDAKQKRLYNGGKWTEARFRSFVVSALRKASQKWPPAWEALANARVSRGLYRCAGCGVVGPQYLPSEKKGGKRKNNAVRDHEPPVVDTAKGFTTWDEYIDRMFCELEHFQILCYKCNKEKCDEERAQRRKNTVP